MFAVRDVPGKGKGLVATQRITKGTCILSEAPVVAITLSPPTKDVEKLWSPVTNLPVGHRQAFEALAKCHPYENTFGLYLSVVRTNSFRIRDGVAGVCIIASRINHACISNAQHSWNDNLKELTVHAVRHIEKDEEITINYMGHGHTRAERQEYLQRLYSFECACTLCSLSVALSEAADRKILRTRKLWSYFLIKEPPTQYLVNPLQRLRRLEEIARYRSELGSSTQLYDTYNEAATLAVFHSDAARAKAFLDRAYNAYILGHGATDETAIACQKRRQDVLGLVCTSPSTRWETDEILPPRDEEFEDWLWKREERLPEPSLFADLEDPSTFMGVGSLPIEGFFDLEYHQNASFGQSQPKRHWCLLGQIDSQPNTAGRLHFRLRDLTNYVTGVSFHDSHKGSKISQSLHTGDTVVILYAQRGKSEIGQTVKIKNTNMFRTFPFPIQMLQRLSARLHDFAPQEDNVLTCHGCTEEGVSFQKCSGCGWFYYCSGECQRKGWKDKDHRTDCKMLQNADLRNLFAFKWHKFDGPVRFPLPSSDGDRVKVVAGKVHKRALQTIPEA